MLAIEDAICAVSHPAASCKDCASLMAPGDIGFSRTFLEEFFVARSADGDFLDSPLLPHQRFPAFALQEGSRIQRLLVYQLPGMGKTRIMIAVLHSHYGSVRPRLVLFPRKTHCTKFYQELLTWPNAYRLFWSRQHPALAKWAWKQYFGSEETMDTAGGDAPGEGGYLPRDRAGGTC